MTSEGAWIELTWETPQQLSEIALKFDSGFQRELTLSASDSITRRIVRAAQPETVRDYSVQVTDAKGGMKEVAAVLGNHQRLNRLRFEPVSAKSVRIHVKATNGADDARIFEIRCYSAA